ncbi:hypothetical protein [Rhizobium sp. ICMP 5592]|uniref:hypothetical protein n=1 Tax=Rhizobium sp. ICMP 5592 TaxID=2292445 RepID=UPI001294BAFF|nr:hypothetical protein [Rhizobium sp. ICMP 5592]MQB43366.1 hypothetical protein [Rhizobium sp. ICMP 5592]
MTHALIDFAKDVTNDARRADDLRSAIDFLKCADQIGALKYAEVRWAQDLLKGDNGSYQAANLVDRHIFNMWPDIHFAVLTRAQEELAAIEARYAPLLGSS